MQGNYDAGRIEQEALRAIVRQQKVVPFYRKSEKKQ
jgi:hypothetical protein